MPPGRRFNPPIPNEEFLQTWADFRVWMAEQYVELRALGMEADFDLEEINAPVNIRQVRECPGCGSHKTAFGSSLRRKYRWVCTSCGLIFDANDPYE